MKSKYAYINQCRSTMADDKTDDKKAEAEAKLRRKKTSSVS